MSEIPNNFDDTKGVSNKCERFYILNYGYS